MKKNLTIFLIFGLYFLAFSQYTPIPDINFENALSSYDDISGDHQIPTNNIASIHNLDISNQNISDLSGIEAFLALETLDCHNNNLTTLDLRQNTNLIQLNCDDNQISHLYLDHLSTLEILYCDNNLLTELVLNTNPSLTAVFLINNHLNILKIKNGQNTNILGPNFRTTNNPDLACIEVDDPTWSTNNWTEIDTWTSFNDDCHYGETYVPDLNFENYLETHSPTATLVSIGDPTSMGNGTANDHYVLTSQIQSANFLNVSARNISDLTGIQDFININFLDCSYNQLSALDLAGLNLTELYCGYNSLTSLDITNQVNLNEFNCEHNQIANLDLSYQNQLQTLYCNDNQITNLNVANLNQLTQLYCQNNQLSNFDASPLQNLEKLWVQNNQLTNLNIGTISNIYSLDCSQNQLLSLDTQYLTNLHDLTCENNQISILDLSHSASLYFISCNNNNLNNLMLPSTNSIVFISCSQNQLSTLSLTQNMTGIERLLCNHNQITSLDLSSLNNLLQFDASYNQLSIIDLSNNNQLYSVNLSNNNLSELDIRNGNNTNILFNTLNNPDLFCIEVDDPTWSTNHWINIDSWTSFNTDCHYGLTYIPDNNFENYLETHNNNGDVVTLGDANSMGNGIADDHFVETLRIESITSLNISGLNIADLTGIEDFQALVSLDCSNNQLQALYLQSLQNLQSVNASLNNLIKFDIRNGNNTNITNFNTLNNPDLFCIEVDNPTWSTNNWTEIDSWSNFSTDCHYGMTYVPDASFENYLETHNANGDIVTLGDVNSMGNGIANDHYVETVKIQSVNFLDVQDLNISDLTGIEDFQALVSLDCSNNQLTGLNINNLIHLTNLICANNSLSQLNISALTQLYLLDCNYNHLSNLDLSHNQILQIIDVSNNNLSHLNVDNFTQLNYLYCHHNQLSELHLSGDTQISELLCQDNAIATLDLSHIPHITKVICSNNHLTSLNIKNGTNTDIFDTNFDTTNNPDLTCIEVDDANWSASNWHHIDTWTSFSNDCSNVNNETAIPDANFEQYLETHDADGNVVNVGDNNSMGNGIVNDHLVNTFKIDHVLSLNVSNQNISDLTGIQDFAALEFLNCAHNQLMTLPIDHLTTLIYIYCDNNQITGLDLNLLPNITDLYCNDNHLSYLNIQNGHNTLINDVNFVTLNNPDLTCIYVDDADWSRAHWSNIDATSNFVNNQTECDALNIDDLTLQDFKIYPNPLKNMKILHVSSNIMANYAIYNAIGYEIIHGNLKENQINQIDLSNFKTGIYILKINDRDQAVFMKVIIN